MGAVSKDDWEIYNRGKLHAYSIILDLLDLTNSYDDIKKTVKRLINRHQKEAENIEKLDNADVAPVVHGYWIYGEDELGQDGYSCSECNFFVPWYYKYYEQGLHFIKDYHLCPHCGAKMDESEDKDDESER